MSELAQYKELTMFLVNLNYANVGELNSLIW